MFCTPLSYNLYYFWSEIDMFRLNVFYITFWDLSNGIHGFSYKWPWKSTFSQVMVRALYRIYIYPEIDWLHFVKPLRNHFLVISYALLPIFGKSMFGQKIINKPTWEPRLIRSYLKKYWSNTQQSIHIWNRTIFPILNMHMLLCVVWPIL